MNVLCIGDVTGKQGCDYLRKRLPGVKKLKNIDLCIVNGENSAAGNGITPDSADSLMSCGADVITTGNHVFRRKEIYDYLDDNASYIIRPANYYPGNPGKGMCKCDLGYAKIAVINLSGKAFMDAGNPFVKADELLKEAEDCRIIICDFHAEATGEKKAMGLYLDGRISAFFGTHTHVQTADEQILPNGTGYITDLGMTGPIDSVLGVKSEIIIERLKTGMPQRFDTADGECMLNGCIFEIDEQTGKTINVERINING